MPGCTPDSPPLAERRDREHQLWLAMRSAYDNYRDASETLDAAASRAPISISSPERVWGIETLAAKQRIEFERYIEKRMQYSEFVRDRSNLTAMHSGVQRTANDATAPKQRQDEPPLWLGRMTSRIAVGAALLCTTAFILREQERIHDLDVARDEMSATLNHTRDDLRSLSRQLSALNVPHQLASQKAVKATAASPRPQRNSVYKSAARDRAAVVQPRNRMPAALSGQQAPYVPGSRRTEVATPVARNFEEPIGSAKSGGRSFYRFTLTPSTQFKQVGTVRLSLRKVDSRQKSFDFCLLLENSKVEKKQVKVYVPVRISLADRLQTVTLVATRIEKNYVQGYLSGPSNKRPEITASNQARQRVRRGS
jgi:hypothetical protein